MESILVMSALLGIPAATVFLCWLIRILSSRNASNGQAAGVRADDIPRLTATPSFELPPPTTPAPVVSSSKTDIKIPLQVNRNIKESAKSPGEPPPLLLPGVKFRPSRKVKIQQRQEAPSGWDEQLSAEPLVPERPRFVDGEYPNLANAWEGARIIELGYFTGTTASMSADMRPFYTTSGDEMG